MKIEVLKMHEVRSMKEPASVEKNEGGKSQNYVHTFDLVTVVLFEGGFDIATWAGIKERALSEEFCCVCVEGCL